jgi:hypothetical protein
MYRPAMAVVVVLVLVSALLHAMWNAGLRLEADKDRGVVIAIAIATAVAAAVAGVMWVRGGPPFPTGASLGWTVVAGLAEAVYFAGLARALELGPLGPVYTVSRGGAVLVVWPASIALWGEPLTGGAIAGSAILLAGLALAGGGAARRARRSRGHRRARSASRGITSPTTPPSTRAASRPRCSRCRWASRAWSTSPGSARLAGARRACSWPGAGAGCA